MIPQKQQQDGILLRGLDGSNPLAYLAALGTLRVCSLVWSEEEVKMGWKRTHGAWRPLLFMRQCRLRCEMVKAVNQWLRQMENHPVFEFADDLKMCPKKFREQASKAVENAEPGKRIWADFVAAFGCDIPADNRASEIQSTKFRMVTGTGHQYFLKTVRNIVRQTGTSHLYKALFEPWRYDDPLRNLSLRWDPLEDRRHALRWRDPSKDSDRESSGSMLGAYRLAVEALPLFPTLQVGRRVQTVGFTDLGGGEAYFTWPIWEPPISLDVCRSLFTLKELCQASEPQIREELARRGIVEVFRSHRIKVGRKKNYYWNFTPAESI